MKTMIHLAGAVVATLCVFVFIVTTVFVEIYGSVETIAKVKELIVYPGLFILVPAIVVTGATGFALAKNRGGRIVQRKMKRMPFIGANGILILVPSAIYLNHLASSGVLDTKFYVVQGVELIAGIVNLVLMGMNMKDGLTISRK